MSDTHFDIVGAIDTKREDEGDWFEHAPEDATRILPNQLDGYQHLIVDSEGHGLLRLKVRSARTRDYQDAMAEVNRRALKRHRGDKRKRQRFINHAQNEVAARVCTADWEFTTRLGESIPFSEENSVEIFCKRDERGNYVHPHHLNFLWECIGAIQSEEDETIETDQGN